MTGLDDLCVRFILNLPHEELDSVERICFQIEEAQWFYEDFIRPMDPSLPSLPLRNFSLLIFQHCPLFAEWPPDAFSVAFSQFLAYKTRVPVRGAIMLNEEMDHVVLVKGWKKSANWSFPRGKINKDETDLDCAIREVYEETGYDIRGAGLVPDEKDMKYIMVTIREQQVGLYVFRGVPMNTYFEPKTRKEISKVEWWKLADLPTFKKNKHQEGSGESLAVNANKFYMVAPFLNDLRKWIARQRKRDAVEGRHLPRHAVYEEQTMATEDEHDLIDLQGPELAQEIAVPSDLPEVSISRPRDDDPSAHLKALLNINSFAAPPSEIRPTSIPSTNVDQEKSNALLSLLRGGQKPDLSHGGIRPYTPQEQMARPPTAPQSPHQNHMHPTATQDIPPPAFVPPNVQDLLSSTNPSVMQQPTLAPYHRTGDPSFARVPANHVQGPAIPPASSLPQLSKHAQTLLDAFKAKPSTTPDNVSRGQTISPSQYSNGFPAQTGPSMPFAATAFSAKKPSAHQNNLLDIFRQGSTQPPKPANPILLSRPGPAPVELAANPVPTAPRSQPHPQRDLLIQLLQRKASESGVTGINQPSTPAAASALLSLFGAAQPTAIASQSSQVASQTDASRTSTPHEPKRITILQRRLNEGTSAPQDFEPAKARDEQRIRQDPSSTNLQPQILQRPAQQSPRLNDLTTSRSQMNGRASYTSAAPLQQTDRRTSQSDAHKQSLLSLFGKQSAITPLEPERHDSSISLFAPSPGGMVSPVNEKITAGLDPDVRITPPVRSRMGSASSLRGVLTPSSTRTTKPDERQFLLDLMTKGHAS